MEQILLAYGIPKETVAAITILYRNTKVKVRSPDGDNRILRHCSRSTTRGHAGSVSLYHLSRLRTLEPSIDKIKENGFELTKKRSRRYPQQQLPTRLRRWHSDTGKYTDQAEHFLHSLERAAASIGLHVNAHKTEYSAITKQGTSPL